MITGYVRKGKQVFQARIRSRSKTVHVGYYETEDEALQAISDYKRIHYHELVDFDRLARDPEGWERKAHEIISKLSKLPNASKVEPDLFRGNEEVL